MKNWSPSPPHVADILEAFYSVSLDDRTWLQGAVDTLAASLPGIQNLSGTFYEVSASGVFLPILPAEWAGESKLEQFLGAAPAMDPMVVEHASRLSVFSLQQIVDSLPPIVRAQFEKSRTNLGLIDSWGLHSADLEGHRVVLTAITSNPVKTTERQVAPWALLSSHLGVAVRLRRRLSAGSASAEAILSPSGSLVHAEGSAAASSDARDALRSATRAIDVARARLRRKPDEALDAWRAVISGRWTLVEQFDTDGRRFMLARVNTTRAKGPEGLSEREKQACAFLATGHSNKQIACEMGVSLSTVAGHLKRASKKLGVGSRVELVQLWNSRMR